MVDRIDREEFGDDAAYRVRINFHNIMMDFACEKRKVAKAVAAGSVPPEMKKVWKQMEQGIRTEVIDRSEMGGSEKDLPDLKLQREMLLDGMTNHKTPGTVVLLTGDGAGWAYGKGARPERDEGRGLEFRAHQLVSILQQVVEGVGNTEWPLHEPGRLLPKRDISSALGESAGVERPQNAGDRRAIDGRRCRLGVWEGCPP